MAREVVMPVLGMNQDTGILIEWLKAEGDEVAKGEPIMEIETDKATAEIEAPGAGRLVNVTAKAGDELPVGQVLALIVGPNEEIPATAKPPATSADSPASNGPAEKATPSPVLASPVAEKMAAEHAIDLTAIDTGGRRIRKEDVLAYLEAQSARSNGANYRLSPASPKARQLAAAHHLEVDALDGSGPNGAVIAADVLAAASAPAATQPTGEPVSRMWQVMAQRLTESWTTIPHFYLNREANASHLVAWRKAVNQRLSVKTTFTDLLVKLVAVAIRQHPRLNSQWRDGSIVQNPTINIGLAVAVEEGLLVPVIAEADRLSLSEIATQRKRLVEQAQTGKLSPALMQGGSFTISNLGMFGIDSFNAIVNPPEAAILALGRIAERIVPVNQQPTVQPMMSLTLSCDHRVVDGARGAQFLQTVVQFIEEPLAVLD